MLILNGDPCFGYRWVREGDIWAELSGQSEHREKKLGVGESLEYSKNSKESISWSKMRRGKSGQVGKVRWRGWSRELCKSFCLRFEWVGRQWGIPSRRVIRLWYIFKDWASHWMRVDSGSQGGSWGVRARRRPLSRREIAVHDPVGTGYVEMLRWAQVWAIFPDVLGMGCERRRAIKDTKGFGPRSILN